MRTIKFRAWHTEEKKMYHDAQKAYDYGCAGDPDKCPVFAFGEILEDSKYIAMQFTDLSDKNGVEIFEGDLVKIVSKSGFHFFGESNDAKEVHWDGCCFAVKDVCGSASLYFYVNHPEHYEVEIIGDIHQNPDLLPQTK